MADFWKWLTENEYFFYSVIFGVVAVVVWCLWWVYAVAMQLYDCYCTHHKKHFNLWLLTPIIVLFLIFWLCTFSAIGCLVYGLATRQ